MLRATVRISHLEPSIAFFIRMATKLNLSTFEQLFEFQDLIYIKASTLGLSLSQLSQSLGVFQFLESISQKVTYIEENYESTNNSGSSRSILFVV